MRWSSRRTYVVTFGVSLALHAALLAWLASRPAPSPPPPANTPVELEIVEVKPAPAPAPAPIARPAPVTPPRKGPPAKPAKPRPTEPSGPPAPIAVAPGPAQPDDFAIPSDFPRADAPAAPGKPGPPGPKVDDLSLLSKMPSVSTPDSRGGGGGARVSDPKAVVDSTVREALGVQRAAGSVPAYFHELRSVLTAAWDVDRVMKRKRRDGLSLRNTRTLLRLVQDREGHLLQIDVLAASRDAEIDTGAVVDLQAVAKRLPVPTPDALGSRQRLVTVWELEFIPPRGPQVSTSGSFDLMNLVDKKAIPPPSIKILTLLSYE